MGRQLKKRRSQRIVGTGVKGPHLNENGANGKKKRGDSQRKKKSSGFEKNFGKVNLIKLST